MKNFSSKLLNCLQGVLINIHYRRRWIGEYVNIYKKRNLISKVKLTPGQKEEIDNLWVKYYGKKIPYYWHRLYASYTGKFSVEYFPEIFYSTNLEKRYNDFNAALVLEDKSQLDLSLRDLDSNTSPTIQTFVFNVNGVYYDKSRVIITQEDALSVIHNLGRCVIKPSMDTDSGRGVRVLDVVNGIDKKTNEDVKAIVESYKQNFLIQEHLRTHETLSRLNPSSVNTIRIITYRCDNKIYHAPLAMRIGANNSEVDNIHAGGFVVGLDDSGQLNEVAFTEYGEAVQMHPNSGIFFKDCVIPHIQDAINLVERKHLQIPRLTFISWDVTINYENKPVILEMNTRNQSAWFPQMVNGRSMFGENTLKMIQLLK